MLPVGGPNALMLQQQAGCLRAADGHCQHLICLLNDLLSRAAGD